MKRHWISDDLIEHFTLLPSECALLDPLRGDHTRLGFAVLLKSFQLDGRFPTTPHEVPTPVIAFLAAQLDADPGVYLQYAWRGRTSDAHRAQIRALLGVRPATVEDATTLTVWATDYLLQTHRRDLARLRVTVREHCRILKLEPPTAQRLDRILGRALAAYHERFCADRLARLSDTSRTALDALLTTMEPANPAVDAPALAAARRTALQVLKSDPGPMAVETAREEVDKLQRLRALELPADLFATVPSHVVQSLRQRVSAEERRDLRIHPTPLRLTLLAAFAWQRQHEVTDTLVDLLIKMIQQIGVKAERRVDKQVVAALKKIANKTGLLRKLAQAAVANPDGIVREVLYPVVNEQVLTDLVAELSTTDRVVERAVQMTLRRSYAHHYRRMVPPILQVLQFRSNNAIHHPLIGALELLTRYAERDETHYGSDEVVPIEGIVPPAWRAEVIEREDGVEQVRRVPFEICVLQALREKLRCKEIWVVGAMRYRNPEEDLPQDFETARASYYAGLNVSLDGTAFLATLKQRHEAALTMLHDGLATNRSVRILPKGNGWIELTPLTAQPEPPTLPRLKRELEQRWPSTRLLDMLKEAALRTDFLDGFKSLTEREHLDRTTLQHRLLLVLYGLGTNTGLKHLSGGRADVSYKDLLYVRRRFITRDYLRSAIQSVVNATFAARQTAIWGEATTSCASDAKKFGAWDQNLITEWHTRYGGRGVVIYWHVEKKSACIYSQLTQCSSSEVAAAITGVLRHCTTMSVERHYVDSHGQSEVAFGLCHLLGYDLCPRLKPIHCQKLYLPSRAHAERYPGVKPVLARAVDWELIAQQYDELVKYAAALQTGTAEAEAILARFTRQTSHPTYKALAELGRVVKTIFLCRYLHDEAFRQEIQEGLNMIENWNSANGFIFYGRAGELSSNRRDDQETAMLALHLLQISLVYVNTLMIQEVLGEPAWEARLTSDDRRGLTPLIYQHVSPYGVFDLDLTTRLPLREPVLAA
jgi:TnpA family transposase